MNYSDHYIPQSVEEWGKWLKEQIDINCKVYTQQPQRLIQDYNTEKEYTGDYIGREVYELLQNANDAAAASGKIGRVLIDLRDDRLIIANTGEFFTIGGVNSLLISSISPKKKNKNLIGQKGLGFRSILNWSTQPSILSGNLAITYDDHNKKKILNWLTSSNEIISQLVRREQTNPDQLIIPTLPFPKLIDSSDYEGNEILGHLRRCIGMKYDTAIGLPIADEKDYDEVVKQLEAIDSSVMLFADSLHEIAVYVNGECIRHWEVKIRDNIRNKIVIHSNTNDCHCWQIYKSNETVVFDKDSVKKDESNEYSIILAVPEGHSIDYCPPLYSFFPLELKFPFPMLCHVTLELEGNRKRPRASKKNKQILREMASVIVKTASIQNIESDIWARVRLLARISDYDQFFETDVQFGKLILDAAKQYEIIPTLSHKHEKPSSVFTIEAQNIDWLPIPSFHDIAVPPVTQDYKRFYEEIGLKKLDTSELTNRLNLIETINIEDRARIIVELVKNKLVSPSPVPELIIDQKGERITAGNRIFLRSHLQKEFDIPEWLRVRFVNNELKNLLMTHFEMTEVRELRQKLAPFAVEEYSLASLAQFIVDEALNRTKNNPETTDSTYQDLLITLYYLYEQRGDASLPVKISVPLLNQSGSYTGARELYFSNSYSNNGDWLSRIYSKKQEKLLAYPNKLGLQGDKESDLSFLEWLGVSDLPREVIIDKTEPGYLKNVLESLPYGVNGIKIEKHIYKKSDDFYIPKVKDVKSLDALDSILESDFAAIIVWLAVDPRCSQWQIARQDNGTLTDRRRGGRNELKYQGGIQHYAKWKIGDTAWLKTVDGEQRKPTECLFGEKKLEKLFPVPVRPSDPLFEKYITDSTTFRKVLENAGLVNDITLLSRRDIIKALLDLPEKDPEGKTARTFYRLLIDKIDVTTPEWASPPTEFMKNGYMWGNGPAGVKYYPVKDLRYAESDDIPDILTRIVKIVDLPKKIGVKVVRKMFGLQAIDKKQIVYTSEDYKERPEYNHIQAQFDKVKPLLLVLRQSKSRKSSEIESLKLLKITICNAINVKIKYESQEVTMDFNTPYTYFIKGNQAYIYLSDNENPNMSSSILADCLGQIIASVFNLESGGEFARLIICKDSERKDLLLKMLGEKDLPNLDELLREFEQSDNELLPIAVPEQDSKTDQKLNGESPPKKESTQNTKVTQQEQYNKIDSSSLRVTPEIHTPKQPSGRRALVLHQAPVDSSTCITHTRVTDSGRSEELIVAFEGNAGRFPILVSNIQGYAGPKCDVISFSSNELKEKYLEDPPSAKNINEVTRFIEVKGSINSGGTVILRGNELEAARTYSKNYFLYRVFEETSNKYHILIVNDPLSIKEIQEDVIELTPNKAKNASAFVVDIQSSQS